MTRKESNLLIEQACALIFQVESALPYDDIIRKMGYRARIELGNMQNSIKESREDSYISQTKVN
jgi:hypothetical protein